MASRGTFGFRAAKKPDKEDKERPGTAASRRMSITSSTSSPSKLTPPSTSFFSRSKHSKKVDLLSSTATSSAAPTGKAQGSLHVSGTRSEPGMKTSSYSSPDTGLGISGGHATIQPKSGKPRSLLRRKAPSIEQHHGYVRTESSASSYDAAPARLPREVQSSPGGYTDPDPRSILGLTAPPISSSTPAYLPPGLGAGSELATSSSHMASFNSRKNLESSSPQNLYPPTPTFHDSSSSTRRSESPGAFSRTSTPTSMSSQSPSVPTPIKVATRTRITSPTRSRPPVTKNKFTGRILHQEEGSISQSRGLTAVRESGTSSSSSSTVKPDSRAGFYKPSSADRSPPRTLSPPIRTSSRRQGSIDAGLNVQPQNPIRLGEPFQPEPSRQTPVPQSGPPRRAPPRPTREGVPDLDVKLEGPLRQTTRRLQTYQPKSPRPVPVVHGRSPSIESSLPTQPSRMPSPNLQATQPPRLPPPRPLRYHPTPSVQTSFSNLPSDKDPSPQSTVSSKSSSRFGFFTKRTKSPVESTGADKSEKTIKKGPTAGTGHEGYGKYAKRGRSGSVTTSASRGRSTSSTSIGRSPGSRKSSFTSQNEPEIDDFYRERLTPKTITGGGQSAPGLSLDLSERVTESDPTYVGNLASGEIFVDSAAQYAPPRFEPSSAVKPQTHNLRHDNRRLPHREGDSHRQYTPQPFEQSGPTPTLATRRSLYRSQLLSGAEPFRIPAPINVGAVAASPDMENAPMVQYSTQEKGSTVANADDISEGHEGNWLKPRASEKPAKSPRKWNFFQRAQASPRIPMVPTGPKPDDSQTNVSELPAAIKRHPEPRPLPFYALLDGSEQENIDKIAIPRNPLNENSKDRYGQDSPNTEAVFVSPSSREDDYTMSMLLPSPPKLGSEFPVLSQQPAPAEPPTQAADDHVDVVAPVALPEPRKPRLQQVGRIPRVVSKRDRPHHPPPQSFSRPRPFASRFIPTSEPPAPAPVSSLRADPARDRPVLGIQTQVISDISWDVHMSAQAASAPAEPVEAFSPIDGRDEFLAFPPRIGSEVSGSSSSGVLSFAATTAVVPEPGTEPESDEVWNEYNEFLDTVEAPTPLARESLELRGNIAESNRWTPGASDSSRKQQAPTYPPATAPTRGLPSPPKKSKLPELPSTPGTISDLLAAYGDVGHTGSVSRRPTSSRYSTSSIDSDADSLSGQETIRGTQIAPVPMRLSEIYLHHEALLASRWLSFDRVLFSPVHYEIMSNLKDRVLVLDGLGNDQWSYYCAENYPSAMIYNFSPVQRSNDTSTVAHIPGAPKPPENHRHIHHPSLGRPFPFPQGFFTAAVFRFPASASDAAYYNAISEFKRVLRPGGFLEMSLLDIDMVNMGNLTRRALRSIKQRKQIGEPEVSLKPLSDNVQKMLGRKGFENLNRCTVEVPVNSQINTSRAASFDETSKDMPNPLPQKPEGGINKNLAKVGRWWFTRCYESGPSSNLGKQKSIWADEELLAECKAKQTGFKLSLCYAQKPLTRRRTRSF